MSRSAIRVVALLFASSSEVHYFQELDNVSHHLMIYEPGGTVKRWLPAKTSRREQLNKVFTWDRIILRTFITIGNGAIKKKRRDCNLLMSRILSEVKKLTSKLWDQLQSLLWARNSIVALNSHIL